jgi:uncharacterized protein YjeT (DUF2065 family)
MKLLITLIGVVLILEGLPYAAFPEATRKWLRQLIAMRTGQLRLLGFVALGCGLLLCYVTQRTSLFQ